MADIELVDTTTLQDFLAEVYSIYRDMSKKRNPSDNDFAKYLGVQPPAFNHWVNKNRNPGLGSIILLSKGLRKIDRYLIQIEPDGDIAKDPDRRYQWRIFDIMGVERVYYVPMELESAIMEWDLIPSSAKNKINEVIQPYIKKHGGNDSGNGKHRQDPPSGSDADA